MHGHRLGVVAGHDPLDWIRSHPERVASLHLRNQHGPVPAEDLLEGDVDVAASVGALPGYSGWLTLELWHPATMTPRRSMSEDTRRSVAFLRDLAGRRGSAPAGRKAHPVPERPTCAQQAVDRFNRFGDGVSGCWR